MPKLVIAKILDADGVSRRELARRLKTSHSNVLRILDKEANPTWRKLVQVAKALKRRVGDLIEE